MSDAPAARGFSGAVDRVVVVCSEGPPGARDAPPPAVGVTRFRTSERELVGIVVKLGARFVDADGAVLAEPEAIPLGLSLDRASRFSGVDPMALDYASDFVPQKRDLDLFVVGSARAPTPVAAIPGRIVLPDRTILFSARSAAPQPSIPLTAPYVDLQGAGHRLTPAALAPPADPEAPYEEGFDGAQFNAAAPGLQLPKGSLTPGARLTLEGLRAVGGAFQVRLPELVPHVSSDGAWGTDVPVTMSLDTVWLDVDEGVLALVYRGNIHVLSHEREIERIVVSLERAEAPREGDERLADTMRGSVSFAWTEGDLLGGRVPSTDDPRLELARYGTWAAPAPEPRIPLERYAHISAELGEAPKARGEVLARHDLDDDRWFVEERAWLERFAAEAMGGDGALAERFGALFVAAQDAMAAPDETTRGLRDYAELLVAMERRADPMEVLGDAGLTMAAWMRLDRRMKTLTDEDPEAADELDDHLTDLRATPSGTEPPPAASDDEEDP